MVYNMSNSLMLTLLLFQSFKKCFNFWYFLNYSTDRGWASYYRPFFCSFISLSLSLSHIHTHTHYLSHFLHHSLSLSLAHFGLQTLLNAISPFLTLLVYVEIVFYFPGLSLPFGSLSPALSLSPLPSLTLGNFLSPFSCIGSAKLPLA